MKHQVTWRCHLELKHPQPAGNKQPRCPRCTLPPSPPALVLLLGWAARACCTNSAMCASSSGEAFWPQAGANVEGSSLRQQWVDGGRVGAVRRQLALGESGRSAAAVDGWEVGGLCASTPQRENMLLL